MSSHSTPQDIPDDEDLLDADEADEEIPTNDEDGDDVMDSGPDEDEGGPEVEIQLVNDSIEHFDGHGDSIFCIARHPTQPGIVATGGGDDKVYVWNSIPASRSSQESSSPGRTSLPAIAQLTGHTDSVNCITYTLPSGDYLLSGGLDGKLRAHKTTASTESKPYPLLAETQEVPEINWIISTPHPKYPNTIALGASDGSVWVYTIDASDKGSPIQIVQAFYLHLESCTAGAWTPDGKLLATVSEGGQLLLWDPFGEAAAAGVVGSSAGSQAIINLGTEDQRFAVEGGLYSVAIAPSGAFAAVGGAGGMIRIVGLPRLGAAQEGASVTKSMKGGGAKNKPGGGKAAATASAGPSAGQAGQILASVQAQSDGVESIAFAPAPLPLMATGSVDGSIAIIDTAHRFAVRRHIKEATEDGLAVVKVEFGRGEIGTEDGGHLLKSCGMDGIVRRWDTRGGTTAAGHGLVWERRGHRGGGEGGGVMGYVTFGPGEAGGNGRIVTAGDDGVALVFET